MNDLVLFWILAGGLGFGFALAVQMRMMTALVLRRALCAWNTDFADHAKANAAVVAAAGKEDVPPTADPWLSEASAYLKQTYPSALSHLRTARKASTILPIGLILVLAMGRFGLGVI